jgi:hypothetical protein
MTTSPRLGIPFISGQQAQPEVTHNQAVLLLQATVGGAITQQNAPPGAPDDGDCYIVGTAGSGDWVGKNNCIAIYLGGWLFLPGLDDDGVQIAMGADQAGLNIFRTDLETIVFWDGATWGAIAGGGGGNQSSGDFADSLADLIDVDVSGAVDGYVLTYDAILGKWVAEPSQGGDSGGGLSSGDADIIESRHIIGTQTNDDAPAGYIGEYFTASRVPGSAIALTTGTVADVVTLNLPAGDFDLEGDGVVDTASGAATQIIVWVSIVSVTIPNPLYGGGLHAFSMAATASTFVLPTGRLRVSLAAPATVYLSCRSTFAAGSNNAYGTISARRAR